MSLELIHLRKLLKIFFLEPNRQTSELRADIRSDLDRDDGRATGGGDFHAPFWSDVRDHVFHVRDIRDAVRARIELNTRRGRLYPRMRDGFLQWWDERRRWTNEPFQPLVAPHARFLVLGLGTVKVEGLLAVADAAGAARFIYPYFAETPVLSDQAARLGLWLIAQALPNIDAANVRILDVIRGRTFSIDRTPLTGNEEGQFRDRYALAIRRWNELREEYD